MITTVTVGGVTLDPGMVLAEAQISHGRQSVGEPTAASVATIRVEHRGAMPTWHGGDVLTVDHVTGRLFSGRVTDCTLEHGLDESGSYGTFIVTAAGGVARLGLRVVGDEPFPQEPGSARAERILQLAEVPYVIDGPADAEILPRDVDAQPALGLLEGLAADTSAAVFDLPTGEVVYQSLSGRNRPVVPYMWSDFPPGDTWAGMDPTLSWAGAPPSIAEWPSPTSEFPVDLPGSVVLWGPQWQSSEGTVINHIRVGYGAASGSDQATTELIDQASVDGHGRRYVYLGTQLALLADAQARAQKVISTQSQDRWALDDVDVQLDLLDETQYAAVMALTCGDHVVLHDLPSPSPASDWPAIVEGWQYIETANAGTRLEQITLLLSDPLHSLAVMRWDEYPTLYTWAEHPTYLTWADLTSPDMLTVGGP